MRRTLTGMVSLAVLMGTVTAAGATAAEIPERAAGQESRAADLRDRLLAIPGMTVISEEQVGKHRYFELGYEQPVDHRNPSKGTFQQRLTLLHKDVNRPTVFHTSGYFLWGSPERSEPARIIDGNEVNMEHRFFPPSRPSPADWSKLTIKQAADDQHRLFTALKSVYTKKWISTGASKGGMTATYYERFHPNDMDGVVAYVAPNDVHNKQDTAYDRFFRKVGTEKCRGLLAGMQREGLIRRAALEKRYEREAAEAGETFTAFGGGAKQAYESGIVGMDWGFWQYAGIDLCDYIPAKPAKLSSDQLYDALNELGGIGGGDSSLQDFVPYYYQAGTELGSPSLKTPPHLRGLVRYPEMGPRDFVPKSIPMTFKPKAMADVDRFVRDSARRMLFVNGEYDPWAAEPFRLGRGAKDSYVMTAPKASHMADISMLGAKDRALATAKIQEWAGVATAAVRKEPSRAEPLAAYSAQLDRKDTRKERSLRP
ncbi:S28 family serine protease [Streptomyces sp. NPDC001985]|uniref:S28 family serine protease n=1 Tax=Streptomyces sp. NPDC001985 TaxID=3154406 RepID=UPI003326EED4